jgi:hypothetical protein
MPRSVSGASWTGGGRALAIIATVACLFIAPAHSGATTALPRPFAPDSFWNQPLAGDAAVDPRSSELVAELLRQRRIWVPWINTSSYSAPVYVVGPGQPRQTVHLDHGGWWAGTPADADVLRQQFASVPVPDGARPAGGSDRSMIVWQPSSDTMWELLGARHVPGDLDPWSLVPGWHAEWGARIDNVSTASGVLQYPFGVSSSGLALAGGMISAAELEQGHIDHAVALGIPQVRRGVAVAPATRTDGRYLGPNGISEGQRFRLDPSLDVASLHLPRVAEEIAYAAQRYGIVVRDVSGAISFYAQDPRTLGYNPYPALFGGLRPDALLARFPFDRLQALAP